jgi:light-regulated signal transduction histidine kinase (bacteriophytochrome)
MATIRAKPVKQVKLNDTISELLSLMQKQIQEANGSVEVGDLPTIVAEASQISQVF